MTDLGQGKTLLPDTREENEIHPSGVNGVTTDSLAPGLAPGESAAPTLTVSLGGVRRAEAGGRLPRTPPGQHFLRQAAREGHPGGAAGPVLLLRCSSCGCGQAGRAHGKAPLARQLHGVLALHSCGPRSPAAPGAGPGVRGSCRKARRGGLGILTAQCTMQAGMGPSNAPHHH